MLSLILGIIADEAEDEVRFRTNYSRDMLACSTSTLSFPEDIAHHTEDIYDLSAYMDQVSPTSRIHACRINKY